MEIIRHITGHAPFPHPVVSLGNFDGVHLGHQAILRRLVQEARARDGTALVLTFHPHPLTVLRPAQPTALILSLRDKLACFAALGVHGVVLQHFTLTFSRLTPEAFMQQYLLDALRVEKIIVGHNVSFGRNRAGRVETLQDFGRTHGFEVERIGPVQAEGQEVSSTEVRALLGRGDMRAVALLLGRLYTVGGQVKKGFQRGRTIGFPTANLRPHAHLLLPNGVYAVIVEVEGQLLSGVANVGVNPTFGNHNKTIEAHLFDFSADLYGKRLRVGFVERLREERKFPSVQDLTRQIQEDANQARTLLRQGVAAGLDV